MKFEYLVKLFSCDTQLDSALNLISNTKNCDLVTTESKKTCKNLMYLTVNYASAIIEASSRKIATTSTADEVMGKCSASNDCLMVTHYKKVTWKYHLVNEYAKYYMKDPEHTMMLAMCCNIPS